MVSFSKAPAWTSRSLDRRVQPRQLLLPGARPRDHRVLYSAASPASSASGKPPMRPGNSAAPFKRASASPSRRARPGAPQKARAQQRIPRSLVAPGRSFGPRHRRSPPPKLPVWAVMENGAPRDKVDCCCSATATPPPKWTSGIATPAAPPIPLRRLALQRAPRRFQRLGHRHPAEESGVSRPPTACIAAPRCARPTTLSARSATCSRSITGGCAKSPRPRPTSSSKSWSNDRKYGGGGIFNLFATVSAATPSLLTSWSTSSATTSPAWPTNITPPTFLHRQHARPEPWEPNATRTPPPPSGRSC